MGGSESLLGRGAAEDAKNAKGCGETGDHREGAGVCQGGGGGSNGRTDGRGGRGGGAGGGGGGEGGRGVRGWGGWGGSFFLGVGGRAESGILWRSVARG